jgi:DNA modification methylase
MDTLTVDLRLGDCLDLLRAMPDKSVDLVFTSPPYEAARTYGIGFNLRGQAWVDWAVERFMECHRVSRGLTAWVIEGQTRQFRWSATPALLMADLHRRGVKLRKPPIYMRDGVFGGGGPDWFKNRYEFIVCAAHGRLPWSDNTAMGKPPKFKPGGAPSHRKANGERVKGKPYKPPALANPGNIVNCGAVGGGHLGSKWAHASEAPFPEKLAEFFIRSCCPPGGIVLDPFLGSGTTAAVAVRHDRNAIGMEVRASQLSICRRRLGLRG